MHIAVIVQARMGSSRLPGKTLMPLGSSNIPVLEHIMTRLSFFVPLSQIIVATTYNIKDKAIVDLCQVKNYSYFMGDPDDVLDRYYKAATQYNAGHIVRICADSPAIDPNLLTDMKEEYFNGHYDYLSNTLEDTFPEGLNAEFFSYTSLQTAWKCAKLLSEREHVTPYIKKSYQFKKYSYQSNINYSSKRWTLDYREDYKLLSIIYNKLEGIKPYFSMSDILDLLKQEPELEKINQHITRNEGYLKSLQQDKKDNL